MNIGELLKEIKKGGINLFTTAQKDAQSGIHTIGDLLGTPNPNDITHKIPIIKLEPQNITPKISLGMAQTTQAIPNSKTPDTINAIKAIGGTLMSLWKQHQTNVAKQQKINDYALAHKYVINTQGNKVWSPEYNAYWKRKIQSIAPPVGGIERIGANAAEDAFKAITPEAGKVINEYQVWLKANPEAKAEAKKLSDMANTIPDPKNRANFLRNAKHTFDTKYNKQYSDGLNKEDLINPLKYKTADAFAEATKPKGDIVYRGTIGTGEINNILNGKLVYKANESGGLWSNKKEVAQSYSSGLGLVTGENTFTPSGEGRYIIEGIEDKYGKVTPIKAIEQDTGKVINFAKKIWQDAHTPTNTGGEMLSEGKPPEPIPPQDTAREYKPILGDNVAKSRFNKTGRMDINSLMIPNLDSGNYKGVVVKVTSFGREAYLPLIERYKGYEIVKAGENIAVWNKIDKTLFVVALDDSKKTGTRLIIKSKNNVENARKYIDYITGSAKETIPPSITLPEIPKPNVKPPLPERRFIKRVREMIPEAKLNGQYTPRSTEALVKFADNMINTNPKAAVEFAKNDATDKGVAVASQLLNRLNEQLKVSTDEHVKEMLSTKISEIAHASAANLTEAGRKVQAATILGKETPEAMIRWAAAQINLFNEKAGARTLRNFLGGAKKIPNLTKDQTDFITYSMQKIIDTVDHGQKAKKYYELQNEIRDWIPPSLFKKIVTVWKAGLLTGIRTSGLNTGSNATHMIAETIKDIPAAFVDIIVKQFTGKRTTALTLRGLPSGFVEGINRGWTFFRTSYDERNVLRGMDIKRVNFGKGKMGRVLQWGTTKVFNILGAEDQPFYYAARLHSFYSQAIAITKNEGLKGVQAEKRIVELLNNPTGKMADYALQDAKIAVFQNKTVLSSAATGLKRDAPIFELLMPFSTTPSAVATQVVNYSPIGIIKTIIENIGKGRFDQKLFSQGIGRGIIGTGSLAIGMELWKHNMMTTARPTSSSEQKLWEMEGKQPYAIKIGGQWRNLGTLGPAGLEMGVGAALAQGMETTGSFIGGIGASLAATAGVLTQQTFLYGINQAINALNDPSHYGGTFLRGLFASVVPTIMSDIARATDPLQRKSQTVLQRIESRVPGLRETLPPRVDTLGKPEQSANWGTTMFDPTRPYIPTENLQSPIMKELQRLSAAGYPSTPTMAGGTYGYKTLTPRENSLLWQNAGQMAKAAIQKIMKDPAYNTLDDQQKSKIIDRAVSPTKSEARGLAVYEATKRLRGEPLALELANMQVDKLLTKNTYAWYWHYGGRGKYPILKQ